MSHISYLRAKKFIIVLPLLLLLAFFLVGCGSNTSSSATNQTNTSAATSTPSSPTDDATKIKNGDQQTQKLLQSLDNAQKDANDASSTGDQQDTNQVP